MTLRWAMDPSNEVSHLLVYLQRTDEARPVLVDRVKALARTISPMPVQEGDVYRLQAVSERGVKSPLSEAVQVKIP